MQTGISAMTAVTSSVAGLGRDPKGAESEGIAGASPSPFSNLLTDAVGQVNSLENSARAAVEGLMTGSGVDVHQAMIATQKADMGFELALAVRNKAVQAYQSVMGMQF
ncbi:MAG: flagellar hook-basal body complex protein FliE [Terracidiphilus sp.]